MNKRIKQLVKQATEDIMKNTPSFLVTNEMWQEKFAELIVKETIMQMAIQMDKFGDNQANNPIWYKSEEALKQHFGVKE